MSHVFCDMSTFNVGFKVVLLVQYYTVNSYLFISKCVQHILHGILYQHFTQLVIHLQKCVLCVILEAQYVNK